MRDPGRRIIGRNISVPFGIVSCIFCINSLIMMLNKNNTLPLGLLFVHLHILKSFTVTYNIDQGSGMGIGCGEVGRAVVSDTGDPWFNSSHRQLLYWALLNTNCTDMTKIKKKRSEVAHFLAKQWWAKEMSSSIFVNNCLVGNRIEQSTGLPDY